MLPGNRYTQPLRSKEAIMRFLEEDDDLEEFQDQQQDEDQESFRDELASLDDVALRHEAPTFHHYYDTVEEGGYYARHGASPLAAGSRNAGLTTDENFREGKARRRVLPRAVLVGIGVTVLVVLISVGLIVGSFVNKSAGSKQDDVGANAAPPEDKPSGPTSAPEVDKAGFLLDVLESSEIYRFNDAIIQPLSPQFNAYEWMFMEDKLTDIAAAGKQGDSLLPVLSTEEVLERYAAAVLYFSLGLKRTEVGSRMLSPTEHLCDWNDGSSGFSCSDGIRRVSQFKLAKEIISGKLPVEFGLLTFMKTFETTGNPIEGLLPTEMGNLSSLQSLKITKSRITGSIPSEFFRMTSLETLIINSSRLTGSLPGPEFANLAKLRSIEIVDNLIYGQIPEEIASLSDLSSIILEKTLLVGSIPTRMWTLPRLSHVQLRDNHLIGSLPSEISSGTKLSVLYLGNNRLNGTLPANIGSLSALSYLHLQNNRFSGQLPKEIGNLGSCFELLAHENRFSGTLPPSLGSMTGLGKLALHSNDIGGPLPSKLASIPNLYSLSLNNNSLFGTVPKEYAQLSSIVRIYLHSNELVGSVDEQFCISYSSGKGNGVTSLGNRPETLVLGMEYCESAESYVSNGSLECSCCTECCDADGVCYKVKESSAGD